MSRISLIIDAWIREAQEASQWVENLESKMVNHKDFPQSNIVDFARSKLLEIGTKLDRLESLLRNPSPKPILTDEDLAFRWKMLSDIQLKTRALARSLYTLPSPNRPRSFPAIDSKECDISTECCDQDPMKTSNSQDHSDMLKALLQSDDASRSQLQMQPSSSFVSVGSLWKGCSTISLFVGLAALLFIVVLLCSTI